MMIWLPAICGFLMVLILIPFAKRLARRAGYVDIPDEDRKQHQKPVPPIGGLIVFPVFIGISFLFLDISFAFFIFVLALLVLLVMGAFDEYKPLHPWVKFFIQFCVASAVVLTGPAHLHDLGDLFGLGVFELSFMSIPFSIAAVMLLVNAVNLMDGLDGLAGGYGLMALSWLMIAATYAGSASLEVMLPLAGCLLAFLIFNARHPWRRRASVFMGDGGSLCLGMALAWFSIDLAKQPGVIPPIAVAWILALPIMDTCAQFYRRVREGRHPFSPDRGHFHHHFVHAGIDDRFAVALIISIVIFLGGFGYVGSFLLPPAVLTFSWIALIILHMSLSRNTEIYSSVVRKTFAKSIK